MADRTLINVRDIEAIQAARPFLVAHRGGGVGPDAPENSLRAIELAAVQGYAMVELDVLEAADGEPVLMHGSLRVNCGVDADVHDLTSTELTALRYRGSDQCVLTFAAAIETCGRLRLGVMLDKLRRGWRSDEPMSARCLARVGAMLKQAGLASATVAIVDNPLFRKNLNHVPLFPIAAEDAQKAMAGGAVSLAGGFWFGGPAELPDEAVPRLQEHGAFVVVSINDHHYPPHAHHELARGDIERLKAAGVDGIQIDSMYHDHFGETQR